MYNFRFDADTPPALGRMPVTYFEPGTPVSTLWVGLTPDRCGDNFCETPELASNCPEDCSATGGGAGQVPNGNDLAGAQLTFDYDPASGQMDLFWGDSCSTGDTDYGVYSGVLGDFGNHGAVACGTAGLTEYTFDTIDSTSRYYLIVPYNVGFEGSYGTDSTGTPRPAGTSTCKPQDVLTCP